MSLNKRLARMSRAFATRFTMREERDDLIAKGHSFPADTGRYIWKEPSEAADFVDLSVFLDRAKPTTLIDVGANVGKFTKGFTKYFADTEAHCFEPVPATFEKLTAAVGGIAELHCLALSDAAGEAEIWIDDDDTLNSLERYRDVVNEFYNMDYSKQVKIRTARLDDLGLPLREQVMLKVDVQGHEVAMLSGATETLKRVDAVLAELAFVSEHEGHKPTFSPCCEIMRQAGLYPIVFQEYGRGRSNYGFERDVIFVREGLLDKVWR